MFHVKPSIAALNLLAESAPARRLDPDALARRDPKVRLARELSSLSACTHEIVDTPCAGAANPQGAIVRRSVSRLTFDSTRHSSSRISPSPPLNLPRPPDPCRIRYSVMRIG